jgi:hypothetical protein
MVKLILLLMIGIWCLAASAAEIPWSTLELVQKGRIDAIAYLGNGVVVAGTRDINPSLFYKSIDYGLTWKKIAEIKSTEKRSGITCIVSGGDSICYLLNESSEFFRSLDLGDTWQKVARLSNGVNEQGHALSYGICVTNNGSVLVSDSNSSGGSVYRSTDKGLTFSRLGVISNKGLYRFTLLENKIIVNGWEGVVYASTDDGLGWERLAEADNSPLYATESLDAGEYMQGTQSGNVFIGNESLKSCKFLGKPGGAADDFVYLGYGVIIYTTYTESKSVFISYDKGNHWIDDGVIPTPKNMDWLDHVIRIEKTDSVVAIGGTNKGYIVRASYSKKYLNMKRMAANPNSKSEFFKNP